MARKSADKAQEARKIVRISFDADNIDVSKLKAALNDALTQVKDDIQKMNEALSGIAPGGLKSFTDGLAAAAGLMESSVKQTRELKDLLNSLDLSKAGLPSVPAGGAVAASAAAPLQHVDLSAGSEQLSRMVTLLEQIAVSAGKAEPQMQAFASTTNKTADAADKAHGELRKELDEMEKLRNQAEQTRSAFMMIGGAFAATTASVVAFGRKAVTTAGQFEKLRAKLVTAQHSASKAAETFEFAKQLAATTPFDVQGVVGAAVQLEVYGQKSQEILPKVADLAAGMGMSIEEAARVVGKALSGSREGLESLRNTYGVSTQKLIEHGAAMNKQGSIALETAEDLGKMKKALLDIIDTDFAGAIERQSQTYEGAISNLEDEVANVSAAIGDKMIPVITVVTRHLSDLVGIFSDVPPWAVWATAGAAGLASLSGGIITTVAGMASMSAQAFTAAKALESAGGAGKALVPLLEAIGTKSASVGTLLANNMGRIATGGVIAAGFIAAKIAIEAYEQAEIKAQRALEEETRRTQQAAKSWHNLRNAIKEATGAEIEYASGDGKEQFSEVMNQKGKLNVISAIQDFGYSKEEVKNALDKAKSEQEQIRGIIKDKLQELNVLQGDYNSLEEAITFYKEAEANYGDDSPIAASQYRDKYKKIEQLQFDIAGSRSELRRSGAYVDTLEELNKAFNDVGEATENAVKKAQDLDEWLKFADKAKDAELLEEAVKETANSLQALKEAAAKEGGINEKELADSKAVTKRLAKADPNTKEFELLSLIAQKQEELEKRSEALTKQRQGDLHETIRSIDAKYAYEHAGREKDLEEERAYLQKKLKLYEDARSKEIAAINRELGANPAPEREAYLKARLEEIQKVRTEETKLKNELFANEKALRKEREETAKKSLSNVAELLRDAQKLGSINTMTAPQIAAAFDAVKRSAASWAEQNMKLLNQSEELRDSYKKTLKEIEQARSEAIARQVVNELGNKATALTDAATTPHAQLEAVQEAIRLYEKALTTNKYLKENLQEQAQAQTALNHLKKQELSLTEQIARLAKKQDDENKSLDLQYEQEKLQTLEQRKQSGEDVEAEIEKQNQKIFEMKKDLLDREKQAELDEVKGTSQEAADLRLKIEEEYQKRLLILQEQTDRDKLSKEATKKNSKESTRTKKIKADEQAPSVLGPNFGKAGSPLMTMQEALAEHGKLYEWHRRGLGWKEETTPEEAAKNAANEAAQATKSFAKSASDAAPSMQAMAAAVKPMPESIKPAVSALDALKNSAGTAAQALEQITAIIKASGVMPTPQEAGAITLPETSAKAMSSAVTSNATSITSNVYMDGVDISQDADAQAIAGLALDLAQRKQRQANMLAGAWR